VFTDPEALGAGVAYSEHDWNTGATAGEQPYMYAKTAAEAAAHRAAAAQAPPGRWRLVCINPGASCSPLPPPPPPPPPAAAARCLPPERPLP